MGSYVDMWHENDVQSARCRAQGAECRVQGVGCKMQGAGYKVQGAECRTIGSHPDNHSIYTCIFQNTHSTRVQCHTRISYTLKWFRFWLPILQ